MHEDTPKDCAATVKESLTPQGQTASVPAVVTEEMHVAACKVLLRAHGLDGLPQRMLDAMLAVAPQPAQAVSGEQSDAQIIANRLSAYASSGGVMDDCCRSVMRQGATLLRAPQPAQAASFQQRVQPWMLTCFGAEIASDTIERNHRFLEESLELVQACGCTQSEAHQLVDYVFGRPVGEPAQEVGGVMVTLAALCLAQDMDMHEAGETELARIWTKVEAIRAKQAAKPKHSPLPAHPPVQHTEAQP